MPPGWLRSRVSIVLFAAMVIQIGSLPVLRNPSSLVDRFRRRYSGISYGTFPSAPSAVVRATTRMTGSEALALRL